MEHGFYIMIEGGEGCGKTTQAKLLSSYFSSHGFETVLTKEPGGTEEAEKLRELILHKENHFDILSEILLFEAARRENYKNIVLPALKEGKIVIKARGWPTTITHQGFALGGDIDFISQLNGIATFGVLPDILIIIDIDPELGLKKEIVNNALSLRGLDYHKKVRDGYFYVANKVLPERTVIIQYEDGIEKMQQKIINIIRERFDI